MLLLPLFHIINDMNYLTFITPIVFIFSLIFAIVLFVKSSNKVYPIYFIGFWILFTGVLSYFNFFENTESLPPRFILAVAPPLLLLFILAFNKKGVDFFSRFNLKLLTLLHLVRIGAEITLYLLFLQGLTPELMTFNGVNYDLFSGLSVGIIYYLVFVKKANQILLLLWNIICLIILFNTVYHGILSAPGPFQAFAFDQPNIAVLKYPYIWLPSVLVPLVYYAHFISIVKIINELRETKK